MHSEVIFTPTLIGIFILNPLNTLYTIDPTFLKHHVFYHSNDDHLTLSTTNIHLLMHMNESKSVCNNKQDTAAVLGYHRYETILKY
jgi:hypothetical protein